jgi:hypothetical protein
MFISPQEHSKRLTTGPIENDSARWSAAAERRIGHGLGYEISHLTGRRRMEGYDLITVAYGFVPMAFI